MNRRLALIAAVLLVPATAGAVGLGPLRRGGVTDGPGMAFYLTLSNPYAQMERFDLSALGAADEATQPRVTVFPSRVALGPQGQRRVIVIVRGLTPGERYSFRVCAQKPFDPQESLHARVCSTLLARRLPARA